MQYVYGEPSKDPRARRWNPLGFKIVDYRAEAEVLPAPEPTNPGAAAEWCALTERRHAMIRKRPRLNAVALVAALSIIATASRPETVPMRGAVDARIRTTTYNADQVYKLHGFVGYAIELIFEDGETFSGTGGGDLQGVTVDAHGNSVLLKPKAALVATNLVVFTDRRAYRFDYSVFARRPDRFTDELIYAVRFAYPPKQRRQRRDH